MVTPRLTVCVVCLVSLVALSTQDPYTNRKRAELLQETFLPDHDLSNRNARQSQFWGGSRYGRGGHDGPQPRLEVEPRGDRFFMGSRYGKRSSVWPEAAEELRSDSGTVSCLYTGILNLFHCIKLIRKDSDGEKQDMEEVK